MFEKLISKISLNIKGRNINRFIKKLKTNKIEILSIKYKNKNEADIIIYKKDYQTILKIKKVLTFQEFFDKIKDKDRLLSLSRL